MSGPTKAELNRRYEDILALLERKKALIAESESSKKENEALRAALTESNKKLGQRTDDYDALFRVAQGMAKQLDHATRFICALNRNAEHYRREALRVREQCSGLEVTLSGIETLKEDAKQYAKNADYWRAEAMRARQERDDANALASEAMRETELLRRFRPAADIEITEDWQIDLYERRDKSACSLLLRPRHCGEPPMFATGAEPHDARLIFRSREQARRLLRAIKGALFVMDRAGIE